jgi:hypothetical protein
LRQRLNQTPSEVPVAPVAPLPPAPKVAKAKPAPKPQTQSKAKPEPAAKPVAKTSTVTSEPKPVFHPVPGADQASATQTQPAATKPPPTPRTKAEDAAKVQAQKKSKETTMPSEEKQVKQSSTGKGTVFTPIKAPPLPISADKQSRLADLLRKYQADQLTPEQYHQQRAKILAEP